MTSLPLSPAERSHILDLAAELLAAEFRDEFLASMRANASLPLGTAAALLGCTTRTIERHCPVFSTGQRDKSITLDTLEAFRARFTSTPS